MFKFFLRWMDSWSMTPTLSSGASDHPDNGKDTKIQWLRILPFILLHIAWAPFTIVGHDGFRQAISFKETPPLVIIACLNPS